MREGLGRCVEGSEKACHWLLGSPKHLCMRSPGPTEAGPLWGSGQPSCTMNAFPRIQHPKVRGGKGVTGTYQLLSTLACLKWEDQALKGQLSTFSAPILHHPPPPCTETTHKRKRSRQSRGGKAATSLLRTPAHSPRQSPRTLEEAGLASSHGCYASEALGGPAVQLPGCLSQL